MKPHQIRKPPMNLTRWKCIKCGAMSLLARRTCCRCGTPREAGR